MYFKGIELSKKIIGYVLGSQYLRQEISWNWTYEYECNIKVYPVHPVNPVIYKDVVYAGFAWSKNLSGFFRKKRLPAIAATTSVEELYP